MYLLSVQITIPLLSSMSAYTSIINTKNTWVNVFITPSQETMAMGEKQCPSIHRQRPRDCEAEIGSPSS